MGSNEVPSSSPAPHLWIRAGARCLTALALMLSLYFLSVGPVTPFLCDPNRTGDRGHALWQAFYADPLGRMPRPIRTAVNRYIAVCDRLYYHR